jgi:hypothetical protein
MQICRGKSPLCGWSEDGNYDCYCDSLSADKISRIKKILDEVNFDDGDAPSWKYASWFSALLDIRRIIDESIERKK